MALSWNNLNTFLTEVNCKINCNKETYITDTKTKGLGITPISYICNTCKCLGNLKYDREECSKCNNGWGCGRSCKLSAVECPKCKQHKSL